MHLPLVSVIMPCYNMGSYIREALTSVGAQSYENWELVVVDDGGPEDGTRGSVDAFSRAFATRRVEYIRHDINRGAGAAGAARNTGIRVARGEFLAFLDPDDEWGTNYLHLHVEALSKRPDVALSYTDAWLMSADGETIGSRWGPTETEIAELPSSLCIRNFVTAAFVCRREALQQCGGYDETLLHADWDFVLRLLTKGYRIQHTPAAQFYYRKHAGGATSQDHVRRAGDIAVREKHLGEDEYRRFMAVYISDLEERCRNLEFELYTRSWRAKLWRQARRISPKWAKNAWRRLKKRS